MWEALRRINQLLRRIIQRALDGSLAWEAGESFSVEAFRDYISQDLAEAELLWPAELSRRRLKEIEDYLGQERPAFTALIGSALKAADELELHHGSIEALLGSTGIADLLHPSIVEGSYSQFRAGHYRDAALNSIVAVFDLLRSRTGLDLDGFDLVGRVFSLERPQLILSDLGTESGRNDQKGFMQMLQGAYVGIRNPKAHSLSTDLDRVATAQYLVFASLLARRIDAAVKPETGNGEKKAQNPASAADG